MNGLSDSIIQEFVRSLENIFFELIISGYYSMKKEKNYNLEMEEEDLSVELIKQMDKQPLRSKYHISVLPETRYYDDVIYNHIKKAKQAKRPDIIIITWITSMQINYEIKYYIEAKNLSEEDWKKSGNKTPVDAKKQKKRYIETGIDNFVKENYPKEGCLTGYIVQGEPDTIVSDINNILTTTHPTRKSELLKNQFTVRKYPFCYSSEHMIAHKKKITLKHFFLKL